MGRKRTCELPYCKGIVEGTRNKRRCDNDKNIHLHQIITKNVKKIMKYIESVELFTANDVNRELFKNKLDKNEKGSMYRLFQSMIRENYLAEKGKKGGLKLYAYVQPIDVQEPAKPIEPPVEVAKEEAAPPPQPAPKMDPEAVLLGKIREFVQQKQGSWNHDDWLYFVNRDDIKEFGVSHADIGRLLEEEKTSYWIQRNG